MAETVEIGLLERLCMAVLSRREEKWVVGDDVEHNGPCDDLTLSYCRRLVLSMWDM